MFALEKVSAKDIRGRVVRVEKNNREPSVHVTLYCAVLKRENFELVCQKATEVGVSEIVPLVTDRTVKTHINKDRLEKIIVEAAEQSGRARIPVLCDAMRFDEAIGRVEKKSRNLFFDLREDVHGDCTHALFMAEHTSFKGHEKGMTAILPDAQQEQNMSRKNIIIFIGPEGGWSDIERELAQKQEFEVATLGPLTLRGETAAIIAAYLAVQRPV